MEVGETEKLVASILPEDATNQDVVWRSSKPEIATVDEAGTVRAISPGTTTITAEAEGKTATCGVTVIIVPEGAVDLGLVITREDGSRYRLFWAKCNLGASSPEERGDFFAWGETTLFQSLAGRLYPHLCSACSAGERVAASDWIRLSICMGNRTG